MFETWQKRTALKAFRNEVGPALRFGYGRQETYLPEQVERCAREVLGERFEKYARFLPYAYAIYCGAEEFARVCPRSPDSAVAGEELSYVVIRAEVATSWYAGDQAFTVADVLDSTTPHQGVEIAPGHPPITTDHP